MKKIVLLAAVMCVNTAVFAQEKQVPQEGRSSAVEHFRGQGHESFAKAHQEQMAKMKATQGKMSKLVKEYNALKDGKKKEAKRAEIEKEVSSIRQEQLVFKQNQLGEFEKRLTQMKQDFAKDNTDDAKKAWVTQKTQALIEKDGNVKVLFERPEGMRGPHNWMRGEGKAGKHPGPHFGKLSNGKSPADERPVQHPVTK